MASVYTGLLALLTEFGIGSAIVMLSGLSEDQIAQINTLSILLGIAGFLASCAAAIPLGTFFGSPQLPQVIIVLGLGFIINSLQTVPNAMLQKEHRFKALSIIGAIRAIAQSCVLLLFAWLGFRYWSLVFGVMLSSALGVVLSNYLRRQRLAIPRISSLKSVVHLSGQLLVIRLSWYTYSDADFAIAGRLLGQTALGSYTLAWDLANTLLEKVTTLISSVTPAFFAAVKNDPIALRRYLLRPIEGIALVIFPTMLGMSLVARDGILTLLGEKWEASIPVLQVLALYASMRSIMPLFAQVLTAIGEAGFVMWNGIISMVVLPASFIYASRWGIVGIADAWVIVYPVNAVPIYWRVHQKIGLSHREFFRALLPAINGTIFMVLAVAVSKLLLDGQFQPLAQLIVEACPRDMNNLLQIVLSLQGLLDGHFGHLGRLVVQVVCGSVAYTLTVWIFHRERILAFRRSLTAIHQ